VSEPSLRWVPEAIAVVYVVLAVLFFLDGLGRRGLHSAHADRSRGPEGSGDAEGRPDRLERHQNGD
jgi:hypothetical protein